jgi:hypothetical protein
MNSTKRQWVLVLALFLSVIPFARAQTNEATLSVDGKAALVLKLPAGGKVSMSTNGYLKVLAKDLELYIWAVPKAKTVDDAVPRVADIIKSEFIEFKSASVKDVQVAGATAKDINGPGNEADDEDPGNAEVVIFAVGGKVFAACVHGEDTNAAKEHNPMMSLLATARPGS